MDNMDEFTECLVAAAGRELAREVEAALALAAATVWVRRGEDGALWREIVRPTE